VTQPSQQVNPWLTGVDFTIQDPAGRQDYERADHVRADYSSAVTQGAGYSLSPDEANDMLTQANNALNDLMTLRNSIDNLKAVKPPAQDPASVAYNTRLANGSGVFDAGVSHVDTEIAYLKELIIKITEAFKKITGHEPVVAGEISKAGGESQQPTPAAPKKGHI
jgi:hypothetical protein